ncbi:MAG: glycosyltransferase family 9 protein [Bacteroidales bacterium]|nr:glycosyltransferase family 9 protein [Bacteroidales bacterium]
MKQQVTLILRFSAMGDVVLLLPAIAGVTTAERRLVVVTRPRFASFFENIEGVETFSADFNGRHKGLYGLIRLFRELRGRYSIRLVADLHDVLRTKILGVLFSLSGIRVIRFRKGRSEKKEFIRRRTVVKTTPPHTVERYMRALNRAGIGVTRTEPPYFIFTDKEKRSVEEFMPGGEKVRMIAMAPFARHDTKTWGVENMAGLISLIDAYCDVRFFLFGGPEERTSLQELAGGRSNAVVVAGTLSARTELALISRMDLMISMDSSNLHLAAMAGIDTVSVWGGTHHGTGFGPWGSRNHIIIGIDPQDLECRPCTIFGSGGCRRSDERFKCLNDISPKMVFNRMVDNSIL